MRRRPSIARSIRFQRQVARAAAPAVAMTVAASATRSTHGGDRPAKARGDDRRDETRSASGTGAGVADHRRRAAWRRLARRASQVNSARR
jgi:hypothetical protein